MISVQQHAAAAAADATYVIADGNIQRNVGTLSTEAIFAVDCTEFHTF
jgi:hypothetical protein